MPPNFKFVDTVPPAQGRTYIDDDHAQETIDALAEFPNRWARVPITYLYPDLEGPLAKSSKLNPGPQLHASSEKTSSPSTNTASKQNPATRTCTCA